MILQRDSSTFDTRIGTVQPDQIAKYLECHGWKRRETVRPESLAFDGPTGLRGKPGLFFVPTSTRFSDYSEIIERILRGMSVIEERPISAILDEVLAIRQD